MSAAALKRLAPEPEALPDGLLGRLAREPQAFELSTAIRIAEAEADAVEIRSDASTLISALPVGAIERHGDDAIVLRTSVPGLVGALGALPPAYTELVMREERRRSRSLSAFLDLFADPLTRFFAGALEKYRLPRLLRWRGLSGGNAIVGSLLALAGLRPLAVRKINTVGDDPALRFAGFFASTVRNASSLASMLSAHSGLKVEVEQFHGRWIETAPSERTAIGAQGATLGVDAMAGLAIRDHAGAFRLVIGPVGYADYLSLEPGAPRLADLMALARLYVGPSLSFDMQIVLRKEDAPQCRLGDAVSPPKLGWNCWARVGPLTADSGDAIVRAAL